MLVVLACGLDAYTQHINHPFEKSILIHAMHKNIDK